MFENGGLAACVRGAAIAAVAAVSVGAFAPSAAVAQQMVPATFADLAERLSPAVVNISTASQVQRPPAPAPNVPEGSPFEEYFREFLDPERRGRGGPRSVSSLGSGFVIDPEGYIVTNNHVIAVGGGEIQIEVNFADGRTLPATLVGRDPRTDIALLKVEADEPLAFVEFGDSNETRVGDWVMAIGNPFGLGGSVSAGIISARNRDINAGPYDDFLQTDAAINRGNSGGPLFNMDGEVIGVNTAIISPSGGSIGIGFSVPSNIVNQVVGQLRQFGQTRRGWLGVRIQVVDETTASSLGLEEARGALVASVDEAGPAADAGIAPGDVITRFNGQEIDQMRDLPRIVAGTEVGSTVQVQVWRAGQFEELEVTIALLAEDQTGGPAAGGGQVPPRDFGGDSAELLGMTVARIDERTREQFNIQPNVEGVVVTQIDPASSAAERGVQVGDVIVQVMQVEVSTPADVERLIDQARGEGRASALLMVNRGGELRFVAVEFEN